MHLDRQEQVQRIKNLTEYVLLTSALAAAIMVLAQHWKQGWLHVAGMGAAALAVVAQMALAIAVCRFVSEARGQARSEYPPDSELRAMLREAARGRIAQAVLACIKGIMLALLLLLENLPVPDLGVGGLEATGLFGIALLLSAMQYGQIGIYRQLAQVLDIQSDKPARLVTPM